MQKTLIVVRPVGNARLKRRDPTVCSRKPNLQIGYALLKSKLGEFTGFGEDSFLLTSQFCSLLARWKVGERDLHSREPSVPEEWHIKPRNSAWKNASTETKVTEVRTDGVLSDGRGLDCARSEHFRQNLRRKYGSETLTPTAGGRSGES